MEKNGGRGKTAFIYRRTRTGQPSCSLTPESMASFRVTATESGRWCSWSHIMAGWSGDEAREGIERQTVHLRYCLQLYRYLMLVGMLLAPHRTCDGSSREPLLARIRCHISCIRNTRIAASEASLWNNYGVHSYIAKAYAHVTCFLGPC